MSIHNFLSATSLIMTVTLITGCTSPNISTIGASGQKMSESQASSSIASASTGSNTSSTSSAISDISSSQATIISDQTDEGSSEASDTASSASTETTPVKKDPYHGGDEPIPDGDLQLVFIGDSQFDNWRNSSTSISELVGTEMGALHYNLGVGGTCAAVSRSQTGYNTEDGSNDYSEANFTAICHMLHGDLSTNDYPNSLNEEFETVLYSIQPEKVDYYIIEYGYNDYYMGLDIYNENDPYDEHTYYGALNLGIKMLKEISPEAHFIICTPCYCRFYNGSGKDMGDAYNVSKGQGSLAYYADYALKLADNIGARKLDAISGTTFNLNSYTYKEYLEDHIHLGYKGRVVYSKALIRILLDDMEIYDSEANGDVNSMLSIADY
ncbi:SGNH/GDSL hydrolase family protein [Butyrivibrio fibrisolvens]|uniref:SGNH/GDSL hydrolase family protein n=1 Tax=Butyrivibrio fibrisolvens TaxID=831 RepID=UPI0003B5325C|nr:SGNH/GDSL hydrolase family protein [Butyrivibrio fibrisolvens]